MDRDAAIKLFEDLLSEHDGVPRKGKANPYSALNGNMFAFVDPEGQLCLRLSEARKTEFNAEHGLGDVIQYGAVMRGYVAVPQAVAADRSALSALFAEAVAHVESLKPKPTKRRK